jgi:hypothetical protein
MKQNSKLLLLLLSLAAQFNCSKLKETFQGDLTPGQVAQEDVPALLQGVYNTLEYPFTSHLVVFPLSELTTDAAIAPTRGSDWDDNGSWRVLHQHQWNADNMHISECFNSLSGTIFAATDLLRFHPTPQQAAEARFLRAWTMYLLLDLFDQVPYREPGEPVTRPSQVRKGIGALNYIIDELANIMVDLPDGPAGKANKYAAKFLLMKCYLNKGVFQNRIAPSFVAGDMNEVIRLADEIINSGNFTFAVNYFDNFAPNNETAGTENIFTQANLPGENPDNLLLLAWLISPHYNQIGINGWTTLSDFYDKFETGDKRRGEVYSYNGLPPNPSHHNNLGFLEGQQYDAFSGDALSDRSGRPLIYTRAVQNIVADVTLETAGIRVIKYLADFANFERPDNDFVFFRFPDVLLMKAEAILRGGSATSAGPYGNTALSLINALRTDASRGASALTSINLDGLLDERGRELWWEGWRRQDMIRFGKFLLPFQEKEYQSDPKYLLFPIPNDQLAVNPNLGQNPGY